MTSTPPASVTRSCKSGFGDATREFYIGDIGLVRRAVARGLKNVLTPGGELEFRPGNSFQVTATPNGFFRR